MPTINETDLYLLGPKLVCILLEHEFQSAIKSLNCTIAFQMVCCHVQLSNTQFNLDIYHQMI